MLFSFVSVPSFCADGGGGDEDAPERVDKAVAGTSAEVDSLEGSLRGEVDCDDVWGG